MASAYRYGGGFLASKAAQSGLFFDPQHAHMGMLELDINNLLAAGAVAGGGIAAVGGAANVALSLLAKTTLILSLQEFQVPGRAVGSANLEYLNGNSHYPTRPQPLGDISVTFRDFVGTPTRGILHQWFQQTFNEETGFMLPPSLLKVTGHVLLFGSTGASAREAELQGVWLKDEPQISMAFGRGEILVMQVKLSVDRIIWKNGLLPLSI